MSIEINSDQIKNEFMDEDDALFNDVCTNALSVCKNDPVKDNVSQESRNSQDEGKRKLDVGEEPCSDTKTENNTYEISVKIEAGNGNLHEVDEDFPSVPKRIRESHNNVQGEQEQRPRKNSASSSSTASSGNHKKPIEYETEPAVLARRQKDIDYGKNTIGYDRYIQQIPKDKRTKDHPRTPPMHLKYTRRGWDGMVKLWRKQLHLWDPPKENSEINEAEEDLREDGASC